MKKICVFVGSRANYSSIKSVMRAVKAHSNLELQVVLGASAILDRFGKVEDLIRKDGFEPDFIFHNIIEGDSPSTMAKSTGMGLMDASMIFNNLKPDMLVVVGDRYEMMSVTLAAAYMNILIVHTMGGEVTGTIDESIRHAITKFSYLHFTASEKYRNRVIQMGENPKKVFNVGPLAKEMIESVKLMSLKELEEDLDICSHRSATKKRYRVSLLQKTHGG